MGVTLTPRQLLLIGGAVVVLGALFVLRRGGPPEGPTDIATPENPLVLDAPRLRVVSGTDTIEILGPALFTYFGMDPGEGEPSLILREAAEALRAALREAGPGLQALGVRVVSVLEPPLPLGIRQEVDAAAGPRFVPGGMGFLLADPQGRILRLDRVPGGAALVCAAARTFGKAPPPDFAATC